MRLTSLRIRRAKANTASIPEVSLAGMRIRVTGTLPKSAAIFDPNTAGIGFDECMVIRLPEKVLDRLDDIEIEEAMSKTVLFDPSASRIRSFVLADKADVLVLIPHQLKTEQPQRDRDLIVRAWIYLLGLTAFIALIVLAFFASLAATLRRQRPAMTIRRLYGATPHDEGSRVAGLLSATMVPAGMLPDYRRAGRYTWRGRSRGRFPTGRVARMGKILR